MYFLLLFFIIKLYKLMCNFSGAVVGKYTLLKVEFIIVTKGVLLSEKNILNVSNASGFRLYYLRYSDSTKWKYPNECIRAAKVVV